MRRIKKGLKIFFLSGASILFGVLVASLVFDGLQGFILSSQSGSLLEGQTSAMGITELGEEEQKYFYFTRDEDALPRVSADAYLVGDLNTGEIILAKNATERYPIASVSKLMTALVSNELVNESDTVKVSSRALATYGENGGFWVGEKIKVSDLWHPLLLESSNDSAEIIAEFFDRELFMRKMNQQALKLKMGQTEFEDPSGLSQNNISTVEDLFKLAGHLYQNKSDLLSITQERSHTNGAHHWFSNNQFLHKDNYIGGKSGYTDPAKQTVVSLFEMPLAKDSTRPVGIVLLQSDNRARDVENLLAYLNKYVYYGGNATAAFDWIKERLDIGSLREPDYVRIAFLGDTMLDRGVRSSINKNFSGNYSVLFDNLEILKKSDIVFANLEGPASDKGQDIGNLYSFRMFPGVIPALKGGGVSIVSVANNHAGDWGREAFTDTLARLTENEILYAGGGSRTEAEKPKIIERGGMKIGFLAFSDVGPNWMVTNAERPGILLASDPRFDEIVQNASEQVDYLVVSFHWGDEYQSKHNARQEYLAHRAIDNGARIVAGHHPHVEQDIEIYKDGFIMYSLGNFIFDQNFSKATMQGAMYEVEVRQDGSMTQKKNTIKLNSYFQPNEVIQGKEAKIEF